MPRGVWARGNRHAKILFSLSLDLLEVIMPFVYDPLSVQAVLQTFLQLRTTIWVFVLEAAATTFCPGPCGLVLLLSACGSPWEFPEPSQGRDRFVLSWFGLVIVFHHFSWFEMRRYSVNVLWRRMTSFEGLGHQGPDRWAVLRYEYMDKQTLMYGADESHK